MPESVSPRLTLLEIGGYAHHENMCSNILKFYFNPHNKEHGLNDLLLRSFLQSLNHYEPPFSIYKTIEIWREVPTASGRIDIVLYANKWAIIIENKIRHVLNNDLQEYSNYIETRLPGIPILRVVLSINQESTLTGGFLNLTYKDLIRHIEENLIQIGTSDNQYVVFFKEFVQSIKNMYMPVNLEKEDIEFLIKYRDKISQLFDLENKLRQFINQRANYVKDKIAINKDTSKWVYGGYDIGFHYEYQNIKYKLECLIEKEMISIVACVEPNTVNIIQLQLLKFFKNVDSEKIITNYDNSRVIVEEGIDFFIDDDKLSEKIALILENFVVEEDAKNSNS